MSSRDRVRRLALRCECGTVGGHVDASPRTGEHIVCYCDDCQAYACFLEHPGVLDARGGTEIFQTRPSLVRITAGEDQLACMRLSGKGLLRWYVRCCRTPVGNTLALARAPFVGLVHSAMADRADDGCSRDEALGPATRVHGRFAIGGVPGGVHPSASAVTIARTVALLARGAIAGGHFPSPFFDAKTKQPRALPEVLSASAREQLRARVASSR